MLKGLRQGKNVRIVLLMPNQLRIDYYRSFFPESDDLKYATFPALRERLAGTFFSYLKVYLLRTETMDLKRRYSYYESRNAFRYVVSLLVNRILARPLVRKFARYFDARLGIDDAVKQLFDEFNPAVVFSVHLFGDDEAAILRAAKRLGVPSIGFINSWDKLTSRSIIRILPDYLIVPNKIVKTEAVCFHDIPPEKIFISGAPQFDIYRKLKPTSREDFLKQAGLPITARFFVFCPMGKTFSDSDWQFMLLIDSFLKRKLLPDDLFVLVRFPPNDRVRLGDSSKMDRFVFMIPGVRFSKTRGVDWDMNEADIQSLFDSIYWSELVVCPPSTISIDASILDKPVINLGFDFVPEKSYRSILRFYGATHYRNIMGFGGISLAKDARDLLRLINHYLMNPQDNAEGRSKIVESQVERSDGKAGERIADYILDILAEKDYKMGHDK